MILAFVSAALAATLFADSEKSTNAIIRLLNSRAAGSPRAFEEAAKVVREDAEQGGLLQQYVIALLSREPDAPAAAQLDPGECERFLDQSRGRIRQLAESNDNPLAWYLLSLENNDRSQLERAAAGGNVQALNAMGALLLTEAESNPPTSTNELNKIRVHCYKCFKWASDQGDINGIYNLGICRMNGYGCERDPQKAFECFRAAAQAGHPEAINNLGGFFRDGIVVRRNLPLSVVWFRKSAELNNDFGIYNYAVSLLSGEGIARDRPAAIKLLEYLSERRHHPEGMNLYGTCLLRGVGVKKNESAAFRWFRESADKGLAMAMHNVANCYEAGLGIAPDPILALEWKMRARAASGDRAASEWLRQHRKEASQGGK